MQIETEDNRDIVKCDWCGTVTEYSCTWSAGNPHHCTCEGCRRFQHDIAPQAYWEHLFTEPDTGRRYAIGRGLPEGFPEDTCRECADKLTPYVLKFADIWLLNLINGRLQRSIYEHRKQG